MTLLPASGSPRIAGAVIGRLRWLPLVLGLFSGSALASVCAIPGSAGTATISGTVNSFWTVPNGTYTSGTGSLTLQNRRGAAVNLAPGDLALVIQIQCANIDFSDTAAYGDGNATDTERGSLVARGYSDPAGSCLAGRHEYVRAGPATGAGTLDLSEDALDATYVQAAATATTGRRTLQVIRVPQYLDATVSANLTTVPWNGFSGGLVAVDVARNLTFSGGGINVDGQGFRGGGGRERNTPDANIRYRWDTDDRHASKGEGIAGTPRYVSNKRDPDSGATATITDLGAGFGGYPTGTATTGNWARGAPGNAGGGGNYWDGVSDNGGGGGGGNGGVGGRGGAGWRDVGYAGINADYSNLAEKKWGFGGAPFAGTSVNRLVFGGGSGAGDNNLNSTPQQSSGAAGGGIIMVRAGTISGSATLSARGARAADNPDNDAAGGGGAGGSVVVISPDSSAATLSANVSGGRGADSYLTGADAHGPGGGGGGGVVVRNGTVSVTATGGPTGGTNTTDSPPDGARHGAEAGATGVDLTIGIIQDLPGQNAGYACAEFDWGDAPDNGSPPAQGSYATLVGSNGPNHFVVPGLRLGAAAPDDDAGDQQSAAADADDADGNDDEDGISRGGSPLDDQVLALGTSETLRANVTGTGRLNLWIDLNRDGDFVDTIGGQAEHFVVDDVPAGGPGTRNADYVLPIPAVAPAGTSYVRARWCAAAADCSTPTGDADSGEVEDYRVVLALSDDYGDAPDGAAGIGPGNYSTRAADGGPAHTVAGDPGLFLGLVAPDADAGTFQDALAQADDAAGSDDEDGVLRSGSAIAGQSFTAGTGSGIDVLLNGAGYLNLWVDLNRDGDFDDTLEGQSEHQVVNEDLTAATDPRTVSRTLVIPATSSGGDTFLRVRWCSGATDCNTPGGSAADGEVEDHRILISALDYGDAPDTGIGTGTGNYETILSTNGPRHSVTSSLFIGTTAPDADTGVLRNVAATADDDNAIADEGGIVTGSVIAVAATHQFNVAVTNLTASTATLYAWIDFNQSGAFDEDEFTSVSVPAGTNGGNVTLNFTLPGGVVSGDSYLRLRLTTDTLVASGGGVDERSVGLASDGEVEDQAIQILDLTFDFADAPDVYGTLAASGGPSHIVDPDLRLGLNIDAEADGQPGILAEGDDTLGIADERGIRRFDPLSASATSYSVRIRVNNQTLSTANVIGWIDFDGDENFDADEAATTTVGPGINTEATLTWSGLGTTVDIVGGRTYARFRTTTESITATDTGGSFSDGEVEDYDLVIFGTEQCQVGPGLIIPITQFDFQNPVLEAGTALQQGAIYRFSDITAGVDALIEITDFINTSLAEIDTTAAANGGFDEAFQPTVNLLSQPGEGYVEFVITLVKADTSQALEPAPAFLASAIDVDGDSDDAREFVEFYKPFGTVYRETPTLLNVTDTGSYFRFVPTTTQTNPGIDPTATESIATLRYDGAAEFLYRAGLDNDDGGTALPRLNSLAFGCIEFDNPQTTTIDVDFGDAPDEYPTLLTDSAALHTILPGIGLGATIDAETEGLPDVNAQGDDDDGTDDEDGVTVGGLPLDAQRFAPNDSFTLSVATQGSARLKAWIDWNADGDWGDAGEQVINETADATGTRNVAVTVPAGAVGGTTYARFRYSTDAALTFDGGATNGEVEDYAIVIARTDFGDAPDGGLGTSRNDYTTLEATGGPGHDVLAAPTLYLGTVAPDADDGQLQRIDARADDANGVDDEDGLRLAGDALDEKILFRDRSYDLQITATGAGFLSLWIDLNRDGDFSDVIGSINEQVLEDFDLSGNVGTNTYVQALSIPLSAVVGRSYVRARICSSVNTCDQPTGSAGDGEVEDYRVQLSPVTADAALTGFVFDDNGLGGGVAHDGLINGGEIGISGVEVRLLFDADVNQICDGSEVLLAQTVTAGDGSYALRPAQTDQGKAACLIVATPPGYRSISESNGGNPVVSGGPFDDVQTLSVPTPGTVWNNIDFGDIRLPRLTPDRQDTVGPGGSVSYPHTYDATTDATVDFALATLSESPAGLGWADVLYRDADCSGDLTGSEPADPVTGISVLAGDRVCLIVRTFAPADAPPGALHARELTASSVFTATGGEGAVALVTDVTTVVGGQLRLLKSVRNIGPDGVVDSGDDVDLTQLSFNGGSPGDVLRYLIRFRNEGAQPVRTLVVRDNTPAFTELFVAIACPPVLPPALSGCTVVTPDGSNTSGYQGALEWRFDALLAAGAEGTVNFDVRIQQ